MPNRVFNSSNASISNKKALLIKKGFYNIKDNFYLILKAFSWG